MDLRCCLCLFIFFLFIFYNLILETKNLPPSPPRLPVIGHLHLLKGKPIHRALFNLSDKYGSVLFLRLGSRLALVLSTPSAVEECFTKNDVIFANRPLFASRKTIDYNFTVFASAPYGPHWRNLRRLAVTEILSSTCIQMSATIRTEEIRFLAKKLFEISCAGATKVEMKSFFNILTFNIMMKMIAGNRCSDADELGSDKKGSKFDDLVHIFSPAVPVTLGDYLPFLRWLTFFGVGRIMRRTHRERDNFLQTLIDERRRQRSSPSFSDSTDGKKKTIIDTMLSLGESQPEIYPDYITKGLVQVLLVGGTHTSATTMESAMSQLISHPEILKNARDEIDANVSQSQLLKDSDLDKLPYLHCIINETLRLGLTSIIIPPRESSEECTVGGYNIPRGTMLLVNVWALNRDPKLWEDPDMFKPERFQGRREGDKGESGGFKFKFIPFGVGRRQCPGEALAMRLMALSLGTLIQCFEWEKDAEDCNDAVKTSVKMAEDKPVQVIFRPRQVLIGALSQL